MIKKIISNKIINNIGWLVIDKFLILFLQFFVGVKIANHYGNEIYGEYSYAVAIVAFSPIFLNLINDRVIKEYYNSDFNKTVSVVTTFRNILGVIIFIGLLFLYPFLKNNMTLYILLILLTFDNFLSTMTTGIENYFEYRL
ncbi:MAG: flippase, partial [Cetobacterium sp.]